MCSLAMSFPSVYCPLLHLLLSLFALYFAPGRGCFIVATLCTSIAISVLYFAAASGCIMVLGVLPLSAFGDCLPYLVLYFVLACGYFIATDYWLSWPSITSVRIAAFFDGPLLATKGFVLSMTTISFVSVLVRYAIFVDYKAAIVGGVAMGLVPWMRTHVAILMLSLIIDILAFTIGLANSICLAAFAIATVISKTMLRIMKLVTLKGIYQVLAVLGLVILYINLSVVAISLYHGSTIAYENMTSMSATTVFVVGLWMWIPAIYALCSHLLPGYTIGIVSVTCVTLVLADYIYIPSYPWLWAILIVFQAWCFAIQSSGPIPYAARAIGTIATMCVVVVPCNVLYCCGY